MNRLGVQLYTVREKLSEADCASTLAALKEMGCETVQLFGDAALLENVGKKCVECGLPVVGWLGSLEICEQEKEQVFALCGAYGITDIGVSSGVSTYEDAIAYIPRLNAFAAEAKAAGFTVSYHNHSNECIRTSCGKTVLELFAEGFDPALISFMPDTYWLQHGGCDVRHFLETVKGRVKILHLKDMKRGKNGPTYAEAGQGNLWFAGILQTALDCGIHEFVIEQDECDGDPLDSVKMSLAHLKGLNIL